MDQHFQWYQKTLKENGNNYIFILWNKSVTVTSYPNTNSVINSLDAKDLRESKTDLHKSKVYYRIVTLWVFWETDLITVWAIALVLRRKERGAKGAWSPPMLLITITCQIKLTIIQPTVKMVWVSKINVLWYVPSKHNNHGTNLLLRQTG